MGHLRLSLHVVLVALACAIGVHGFLESPYTDYQESPEDLPKLDQCALCKATVKFSMIILKIHQRMVYALTCKEMKGTPDYAQCITTSEKLLSKLITQPEEELCKFMKVCNATQVEEMYDILGAEQVADINYMLDRLV